MARVFRLLIAVLGLTLLGYAGSVSAAPDCFQVSEKIKRMSVKDGLLEIKNATRQHLRSFKGKGSSYEGQYDIACLIGHYMTLTDATSSTISGEEALDRFKEIENWFEKRFRNDLAEYAKTIALYKNSPDLVEQEREEGYANSEFVLWSLAGSVDDAYRSMSGAKWNTTQLLDEIWCRDSVRAKAEFDEYLNNLPAEARQTDWVALSKSEFGFAQDKFRPAPKGLDSLCASDPVISSRDIQQMKSRFREIAKVRVEENWINSLGEGVNIDGKNWKEISWLKLPCSKAPTEAQYDLFEDLRWYRDTRINKDWWTDLPERKAAEHLFNGQLDKRRQRVDDACTQMIAKQIKKLSKTAGKWKSTYRREVQSTVTRVWVETQRDRKVAEKLASLTTHISLVTGVPERCVSPSKGDRRAVQILKEFVDEVDDNEASFGKIETAEQLNKAKEYLTAVEKVSAQCSGIPQIGSYVTRFTKSHQKYRNWAIKQSARVWAYAIKGRYESDLESIIELVHAEALPTDEEKRAVNYLYEHQGGINKSLETALRELPSRLLAVIDQGNIYREILKEQESLAQKFESDIIEQWNDVLAPTNCDVIGRNLKNLASLTNQCISPAEEDIGTLQMYCRLKELSASVSANQGRDQQDNRDGGADGSNGAIFFPIEPLWNRSNAVQVAGNWFGDFPPRELELNNPVSGAVIEAGFANAQELEMALYQVATNGPLEQIIREKLQGCDAGRSFEGANRRLQRERDFYIGAYDELCENRKSVSKQRACNMATLLDEGVVNQGSSSSSQKSRDDKPEPKRVVTIVWQSDVKNDVVIVSWATTTYTASTGLLTKTEIPEGENVDVQWRPFKKGPKKGISFSFRCCDEDDIENSSGDKVKVYRISGSELDIRFYLKDAEDMISPEISQCRVLYPKRVGADDEYKLKEFPKALSRAGVLKIYPDKGKIVLPGSKKEIRLGEKISTKTPLVLAAIDKEFIVLLPVDSVAIFDIKNLVTSRMQDELILKTELGNRVRDCLIK